MHRFSFIFIETACIFCCGSFCSNRNPKLLQKLRPAWSPAAVAWPSDTNTNAASHTTLYHTVRPVLFIRQDSYFCKTLLGFDTAPEHLKANAIDEMLTLTMVMPLLLYCTATCVVCPFEPTKNVVPVQLETQNFSL